jgi:hypothetical protein
MSFVIASSFGNLGIFVVAIPLLCLAFLFGLLAALFRLRWLSILSAAFCVVMGAALFWFESLLSPISGADAHSAHWTVADRVHDRAELRFFGIAAICSGILLSAALFLAPHDPPLTRSALRRSKRGRF